MGLKTAVNGRRHKSHFSETFVARSYKMFPEISRLKNIFPAKRDGRGQKTCNMENKVSIYVSERKEEGCP